MKIMEKERLSVANPDDSPTVNINIKEEKISIEIERRPKLMIKKEGFRKRTIELFDELRKDESVRNEFIHNPVGIIGPRILEEDFSAQQVSEANRLFFSLLANEKFIQWVDDYVVANQGRKVDRKQFSQDFTRAVMEFGDKNIVASIASNASQGFGLPGIDIMHQALINNCAGAFAVTPVNTPSTSDQSAKSSSNHNGIGFGDLRDLDPAFVRALTEQFISQARSLSNQGRLADLGNSIF